MSACNIAGPQVRTLALSACRGPWARRGLARRGAICQWMGQQQHQVPASQEAGAHLGRSWAGAPATRRSVAASALAPAEAPKAAAAYAEELHAAVEAVQLASRLCQAVQVQLQRGERADKQDDSPVTVADYGAQALVAWSLLRAFPGRPLSLVAEEDAAELRAPGGGAMLERITELVNAALTEVLPGSSGLTPGQVADLVDAGGSRGGPVGRHWVLDPIDGTRGFVGMRQYAVCLGLLEEGKVVLGVLGCPNLPQQAIREGDCDEGQAGRSFAEEGVGTLFAAAKGQGARAGPLLAPGLPATPIQCNDSLPQEEVQYMESYESRHSDHRLAAAVAAALGISRPSLRLDSQAKYGALARGDASIFMRFPPPTYQEKIWDHCAGAIIVEEAGARITDAEGRPLDFTKGRYFADLRGGIVAATPSQHAAIMEALAAIRARRQLQ